ncbi:unnamed protein product, partial [Allacma fusca]
MWCQVVKELV